MSLMGKGELAMNYNKLWKLLIDKNMLRKDLQEKAGISSNAIQNLPMILSELGINFILLPPIW